MEHTTPCDGLVSTMQDVTRNVEKLKSNHEWIRGIDDDVEKIKLDINKLKIQIAVLTTTASFIGGMLGGWVGKTMQRVSIGEIIEAIRAFFC